MFKLLSNTRQKRLRNIQVKEILESISIIKHIYWILLERKPFSNNLFMVLKAQNLQLSLDLSSRPVSCYMYHFNEMKTYGFKNNDIRSKNSHALVLCFQSGSNFYHLLFF